MTTGSNQTPNIIERVHNNTSKRTLGVYLSPSSDFSAHTKALRDKTDSLAGKLQHSTLSKTYAYMVYQAKYIPSLTYSLPICSMSTAQLQSIHVKFVSALLNKLGFNKHYPRAVVYGPHKLGGLQIIDLRYEQGVQNTQALLNYVGTLHPIGDYLMISIRHLQVELGLTSDILLYPPKYNSYATNSWARNLIDFLHKHNITVQIPATKMPHVSRVHDTCIMETVIHSQYFTPREISDINLVRIFLQIVTISDLSTGDGKEIAPDAWHARRMSDRKSVLIRWPRQPLLSKTQTYIWQRMLRKLYLQTSSLSLRVPLGPWTNQLSNMQWEAHVHPTLHCMSIQIKRTKYAMYKLKSQRNYHQAEILPFAYTSTRPPSGFPSTLVGTRVYTNTVLLPPESIPIAPIHLTLPPFLQQLQPMHHRILYHSLSLVKHGIMKLKAMLERSAPLYAGSDGGLAHYKGTFSWLLLGPREHPIWRCVGPSDGYWRTQSSTCSEVTGATSFMLFLAYFTSYYSVQVNTTIEYYIDNESALRSLLRLQNGHTSSRVLPFNNDLLSVLKTNVTTLKNIRFYHVKSHQDQRVTDMDTLPLPARINILCDKLAEQYFQRHRRGPWAPTDTPLIPSESPITLSIAGHQITSHYSQQLRLHISRKNHLDYLLKSKGWTSATLHTVDLHGLRLLHHKKKAYRIGTLSKLQHGWLNLGKQQHQILPDDPDSSKCPCCEAFHEDFVHLLTCPSHAMRSHRYSKLTACLRKFDTVYPRNPHITKVLNSVIWAWIAHPDVNPPYIATGIPTYLRLLAERAVKEQAQIGWDNFFQGYISKTWAQAFATQPNGICSTNNQEIWSRHLISTMQCYSIATWELCNDILHNHAPDINSMVDATLNYKTRSIYATQSDYPLSRQDLQLFEPLPKLLMQTRRYRTQWLSQATMIINSSKRRSLLHQHVLTKFYDFGVPSISTPRPPRSPPIATRFVQTLLTGAPPVPNLFPHRLRRIKNRLQKARNSVNRAQQKYPVYFLSSALTRTLRNETTTDSDSPIGRSSENFYSPSRE